MLAKFLGTIVLLQTLLSVRVIARLVRSSRGVTIQPAETAGHDGEQVTVIVPVLNEYSRLGPCLEGLIAQGHEVREILVVDGGSSDGTQHLVRMYAERDPRITLIDARPVPSGWNGKVWGLQTGLDRVDWSGAWILTIDADVRPTALLVRSLLAHARSTGLSTLSVATKQEIEGIGENLIHPSMLTTLVYRFGIPGGTYRHVNDVQANGQCFLIRRNLLDRIGGFAQVHDEICEDITLARRIVDLGGEIGFFETSDLVSVRMYPDWRTTWREWPRSLPMRDRYFGLSGLLGLLEVLFVQAVALPLLVLLRTVARHRARWWALSVNTALAATRIGILVGTARAYRHRRWSYWLSPLSDLPVSIRLIASAVQREHRWRGRPVSRGTRDGGRGANAEFRVRSSDWTAGLPLFPRYAVRVTEQSASPPGSYVPTSGVTT